MRSITTDRKKTAVNKHWSAKDRVKAVASYLVLGNMAAVAEATGIPLGTLNYWKTQPWWFEQVAKIHQEEDQDIDSTFTRIVKKTQEVILDRIEHGDFYVDREGHVLRKPVGLRDAALAGAIALDKRKVLRDVPAMEQNKIGMQERLKNLETEFKKLVKREESIIDVTSEVEVISEEEDGEEGLHTGEVDRDTGSQSSEGAAEPSPAGDDQAGESARGGREGCGTQESDLEGREEHLSQSGDAEPVSQSFFRPAQ